MPIYDYDCSKCDKEYEIIKSIKEYTGLDPCPDCGNVGNRIFSCNVHFIGTKIEDAEFNVGLGQVTKSKRHREELAKQKGLIEVGNENPEKIHKANESMREDKRRKSYEDL